MPDIDFSKLNFSSIVIKNDLRSAREKIVKPILDQAACQGYSGRDRFALRLGLEEAICNAFKHGNKCDPHRSISARWCVGETCVIVYVADDGVGFDPAKVPNPRCRGNLEKPSGRGLLLMKAYMTDVKYNDRGNEVCMIKIKRTKSSKTSAVKKM
ncbi:MAG: ATP-binding protein [Phycisphaerae bacterium]